MQISRQVLFLVYIGEQQPHPLRIKRVLGQSGDRNWTVQGVSTGRQVEVWEFFRVTENRHDDAMWIPHIVCAVQGRGCVSSRRLFRSKDETKKTQPCPFRTISVKEPTVAWPMGSSFSVQVRCAAGGSISL